jgi:hypothetical protein
VRDLPRLGQVAYGLLARDGGDAQGRDLADRLAEYKP